jgi:hypothetical protein
MLTSLRAQEPLGYLQLNGPRSLKTGGFFIFSVERLRTYYDRYAAIVRAGFHLQARRPCARSSQA